METTGAFELIFYALMFCDEQEACNTAGDSIKIIINQNTPLSSETKIDYDNIGIQRAWRKMSFYFANNQTTLDVNY
jgi:hypothetical protein